MEDKCPSGTRELKLGESFTSDSTEFHTLKYDFKPESGDIEEEGIMQISANNQVTVTHSQPDDDTDVNKVTYKGSAKDYQKEYVLIVDHVTGEVTLERLSKNIQLKKTRVYKSSKGKHSKKKGQIQEDEAEDESVEKYESPKELSTTMAGKSGMIQRHSPLHPSPPRKSRKNKESPSAHASTMDSSPNEEVPTKTAGPSGDNSPTSEASAFDQLSPLIADELEMAAKNSIGSISGSSSSDSSSGESDDESDSDKSTSSAKKINDMFPTNGYLNGLSISPLKNMGILQDDLQLSESGSECD